VRNAGPLRRTGRYDIPLLDVEIRCATIMAMSKPSSVRAVWLVIGDTSRAQARAQKDLDRPQSEQATAQRFPALDP
jgi:hypothetical protein